MAANPQDLINIENALKEAYLPLWGNPLTTEASILLNAIKTRPCTSDKIVAASPRGLAGGFGFGSERNETPQAGAVPFERYNMRTKDMYVDIEISEKAMEFTDERGSMAEALRTEMEGAHTAAKWNLGRSLYGDGRGILANVTASATAGNTLTLDSTRNVKDGIIIDIYATGGTTPVVAGRRILAVNRGANQIIIDGEAKTFAAGFITVQKSYNREITGLGAILYDSVPTIYGINKANNIWIKPTVRNANGQLDDVLITQVLREAQEAKNSNIDMLLFGNDAYDYYVDYLRQINIRVEDNFTPVGGFRALRFIFSNKEVLIANERFVPPNEIWGIDTTKLEFQQTGWAFATAQGSSAFTLLPGRSVYRALLRNYGELICSNPGGCVRIHNLPSLAA